MALTSAIFQGHQETPTQLLPWEDIALIVWGNKVTGDVSGPLRFHDSKAVTQKYLQQQKNNKWMPNKFKEVDWEHLNPAFKNKADNYKIWQSTQTSGFCGTRVQVGLYSGEACPDKRCLNCGAKATDAHLMQCLDEDRTCLLTDNVDKVTKLLETDRITDPELLY
jgi:hypothetical protein